MTYQEDDYLMLSGIQHYAFCPRQWALIHIENQWAENWRTMDGELMHKKAHSTVTPEKRKGVIITRSMPIHSTELGISGICDIVEFVRSDEGISLAGHRGHFKVYPVEYKRGKPKQDHSDILQMTAQAMCLEEMLCCTITEGAMFYGETRRRQAVAIDDGLRQEVKEAFAEMHRLFDRAYTPRVRRTKACNACSLKEICLPGLSKTVTASYYLEKHLAED